jgi:hypothetical protein
MTFLDVGKAENSNISRDNKLLFFIKYSSNINITELI